LAFLERFGARRLHACRPRWIIVSVTGRKWAWISSLLCLQAIPVTGWPVASAEQRSPFGPGPLQSLHTYEPLRPFAPHRYSDPRGFSRLDASLYIGATGSHVAYKSLIRLRAAYMRDAAQAAFRPTPELIPEARRTSGSTSPLAFRHIISGSLSLASPDQPILKLTARTNLLSSPAIGQASPGALALARIGPRYRAHGRYARETREGSRVIIATFSRASGRRPSQSLSPGRRKERSAA
jgi:hypothetical protein